MMNADIEVRNAGQLQKPRINSMRNSKQPVTIIAAQNTNS